MTHLNNTWDCYLSVKLIVCGSMCIPCGKVQGVQFLVALLWDNAVREPSPKGCCCNQSLAFPSSNLVHRRNGSADRRSVTLSAGKISASASYQGWQLTVMQWLDFSDNFYLFLLHLTTRAILPHVWPAREMWAEVSLNLFRHIAHISDISSHKPAACERCVSQLTPQLCGEDVQ